MNHFIIALCNFFLLLVIWQFYKNTLGLRKDHSVVKWMTGLNWFIFTFLISELLHSALANIVTNIVLLIVMTIPFYGNILKKIFIAIVVEAICGGCDYLIYLVFTSISRADYIYGISYVGTVMFIYIIEILIRPFVKKSSGLDTDRREIVMLTIIPLSMLIILYSISKSGADGIYLTIVTIFALLSCFVSYYMYDVFVTEHIKSLESNSLRNQINSYKRELDRIEATEIRIEGIRHDLRHHIIEMQDMVKSEDYDSLSSYLDSISEDINQEKKISHSGRYEVDSLINYMIEEARLTLKEVDVKVSIPKDINVERYQLNVILGNLMENAIDAAKCSEKQFMSISVEVNRGMLFINVRNSYMGKIYRNKHGILSTKQSNKKHGLGLKNVKRIVDDLNGDFKIFYDDSEFAVDVMIYL